MKKLLFNACLMICLSNIIYAQTTEKSKNCNQKSKIRRI